jgi:hypothetical protein
MMRPSGDNQLHSRLDMEKDLTEKEQQLAECTSAIQRNVLTRQISQLRDRLANDDKVGTRVGEYKEDPNTY